MTDFLYPFIERNERDGGALVDDLARSAETKMEMSVALRQSTLATLATDLHAAADAIAQRFAGGGRLYAFGNGGSATDAAGVAALFSRPPSGRSFPARSLVADQAVLTALANDVGYELVFSRQLISMATSTDIAFGLSTSGSSANLLRAFAEARQAGTAHDRVGGLRRRLDGSRGHGRPLSRGEVGQRPSHPGSAERGRVRALAARAVAQ